MKKATLLLLSAAALFSVQQKATAQKNKAFAITSETQGSFNWNTVKEIDLATGDVVKTVYDAQTHQQFQLVDALTKTKIQPTANRNQNYLSMPMANGVAAAAFDAKQNRLYYTTMRGDELRYFDFATNASTIVYVQGTSLAGGNKYDEANVITRMAIAADGNGYALTNDAGHLVQFTTSGKTVVKDLGKLIDGKKNNGISIHNQCTSWGGDMVGDAYGNLYVISMRNNIFKVNPQTLVADFLGQIKGLPAAFTTNGMAVDADGHLVVTSAAYTQNYFRVNMSTLQANAIPAKDGKVFNTADLAGGNLLYQNDVTANPTVKSVVTGNAAVTVYPNPVSEGFFFVQFEKAEAGKYTIELTDASGRIVNRSIAAVSGKGQNIRIDLTRKAAQGMYMIKITGSDRKVIYSDKVVVQ
jgi:hypothetical protein